MLSRFMRRMVVGGMLLGLVGLLGMTPAHAFSVPGAPTSLSGAAGNQVAHVTLSWSAPVDTGGGIATYLYDVSTNYNAGTQTGTWSAIVSLNRNVTKSTFPCAAAYPAVCTYRLYASNSAGTSAPSAPFTVPWTAPSAARFAVAKSTNFVDATVTWRPPADTGGLPDTYDVAVSNDRGTTWQTLVQSIAATSYLATGSCTNGFVCEYKVWARNAIGVAASASNISKIAVAPGPVQSFAVSHLSDDPTVGNPTSGVATITISWDPPVVGLGGGPYELQECAGICGTFSSGWSTNESIPNNTLSITRACAAGQLTCTYRVQATNLRGGVSKWSVAAHSRPIAPTALSATTGTGNATTAVTFSGPSDTGSATSTAHYAFYVCGQSCSTAANWSLSPTTVAYPPTTNPAVANVICPTAGASCTVRVQFVNDFGLQSPLSNPFTATAAAVPGAPTSLTATTGTTSGSVDLAWTAPANPGTAAISDYEYRVAIGAGSFGPWTSTGSTTTTYTDTTCGSANSCTYKVRAVNAVGAGSASNTATALGAP
jgi:hypothetical protein